MSQFKSIRYYCICAFVPCRMVSVSTFIFQILISIFQCLMLIAFVYFIKKHKRKHFKKCVIINKGWLHLTPYFRSFFGHYSSVYFKFNVTSNHFIEFGYLPIEIYCHYDFKLRCNKKIVVSLLLLLCKYLKSRLVCPWLKIVL